MSAQQGGAKIGERTAVALDQVRLPAHAVGHGQVVVVVVADHVEAERPPDLILVGLASRDPHVGARLGEPALERQVDPVEQFGHAQGRHTVFPAGLGDVGDQTQDVATRAQLFHEFASARDPGHLRVVLAPGRDRTLELVAVLLSVQVENPEQQLDHLLVRHGRGHAVVPDDRVDRADGRTGLHERLLVACTSRCCAVYQRVPEIEADHPLHSHLLVGGTSRNLSLLDLLNIF